MTYYDILFSFFIYGFLGWCSEVAFAAFKQHSFVNRDANINYKSNA